jgi:molybdopterin-containing oxidoreductase family molybdopterin binding subunit
MMQSEIVKTACGMCYIGCGIKVTVEDGIVRNIEGNPDNPQNRGKMCAKGKSAILAHYNPHRVRAPLKRTNPQKGVGVDPGWQQISWAEAIDTVVAAFERIRANPKKLWVQAWEVFGDNMFWLSAFGSAFGSNHVNVAASPTCGKVVHPVEFFSGGGFHQQPDLHYAEYCILVGTQFGIATRSALNHHSLDMAEARARGMKLVVVDPVGGPAASKANEWIPIRPGTDSALALSMLHLLLNEYGVYDAPFLKGRTNAPYLIGANGRYLRDAKSGEPLVYDAADGTVKTHDDPSLTDPALTGSYEAQGRRGRPAFELLREHVAKYPPETTEKFTTIPAATVRRITQEFGQAARIGETIIIDGVELPYRPVCVDWARGTQGHKHGFHNCWALKLVNIVVGAVNVPGGILSTGAAGKFPHTWWPEGAPTVCWSMAGRSCRWPIPAPSLAARQPLRCAGTSASCSRWPRISTRCCRSPRKIPRPSACRKKTRSRSCCTHRSIRCSARSATPRRWSTSFNRCASWSASPSRSTRRTFSTTSSCLSPARWSGPISSPAWAPT